MTTFAAIWALCAGLYLMFAGHAAGDEIAAGAACGLVVALWSFSLRRIATVRFRFEGPALVAVLKSLMHLPDATAKVAARLATAPISEVGGTVSSQQLLYGRRDDPASSGRRALLVLAFSVAPDSFVLRMTERRNRIDTHNLRGPE